MDDLERLEREAALVHGITSVHGISYTEDSESDEDDMASIDAYLSALPGGGVDDAQVQAAMNPIGTETMREMRDLAAGVQDASPASAAGGSHSSPTAPLPFRHGVGQSPASPPSSPVSPSEGKGDVSELDAFLLENREFAVGAAGTPPGTSPGTAPPDTAASSATTTSPPEGGRGGPFASRSFASASRGGVDDSLLSLACSASR